jgi:hypothetical protein
VSYLLSDFLSQEEQMQKHHSRTFSISKASIFSLSRRADAKAP